MRLRTNGDDSPQIARTYSAIYFISNDLHYLRDLLTIDFEISNLANDLHGNLVAKRSPRPAEGLANANDEPTDHQSSRPNVPC